MVHCLLLKQRKSHGYEEQADTLLTEINVYFSYKIAVNANIETKLHHKIQLRLINV